MPCYGKNGARASWCSENKKSDTPGNNKEAHALTGGGTWMISKRCLSQCESTVSDWHKVSLPHVDELPPDIRSVGRHR